MNKRLLLDAKLKELLGPGVAVYFQPPNNLEIQIPAVIYSFETVLNRDADNVKYLQFERYGVKLIVTSLVDPIVLKLLRAPGFTYVTTYATGASQHNFLFKITI